MRRQKKRETKRKRINTNKVKERIEPPPLRKNRDKDIARPQTEDEQPLAMEPSPA